MSSSEVALRLPKTETQIRRQKQYMAASKREAAVARVQLIKRFRLGMQCGYVPSILRLQINRMASEVFSADDPEKAVRCLLSPEVDGRRPQTRNSTQFEAAVAVARTIMTQGLTVEDALSAVAETLRKPEPTVRNWYANHRKEARAFVASVELGWDGLPE